MRKIFVLPTEMSWNINISDSINYHLRHKKLATMTTTYAPGRFGA